jgi:hypothetical protein
MPFVKAGMHEYLLVGRGGRLENRGSAVHAYLRPGTVFALVPSAKQEATFEFTQETKDGIPLRFKGIAVYRITDPVAAAALFDFAGGTAIDRLTTLLTHVCLGELRHAVSHMTMVECIEQRKTTLSGVVAAALRTAVDGDGSGSWGVTVEIAQVAQVFIVDVDLRRQLEAEVRNDIRRQADTSDRRTAEEAQLEVMASEGRISDQRLAGERESLRREEELERARIENRRRMQTEELESQRHALGLEQERLHAQLDADRDRLDKETPLRLLRAAREREVLADELELKRLQHAAAVLDVDRDLLRPRADQELRRQILPIEQAPLIVEAASHVFNGAQLSLYGADAGLVEHLAPVLDVIGRAVRQATEGTEARPA